MSMLNLKRKSAELPRPTEPLGSFIHHPFAAFSLQPSSTPKLKVRQALPNTAKTSMPAKLFEFTRLATLPLAKFIPQRKHASNVLTMMPTGLLALPKQAANEALDSSQSVTCDNAQANYSVSWASTNEELRAAQALRWQVFAGELGAKLKSPIHGLDIDEFDPFCEHLLVKDEHGEVVGTYRALLPDQAELACGWYSSTEFHLKPLLPQAHRAMEVGRSCVHSDHRNGTVMMMLWQALARHMDSHGLDRLFGCVSVPIRADGGRMAASLWQHFVEKQHLDAELFCKPRIALDVQALDGSTPETKLVMPPLLKGYLRLGAKIASAPALDASFGCADFLIVLRKEDIVPRYARHFFGQATSAQA
jgi:putative hemolysin